MVIDASDRFQQARNAAKLAESARIKRALFVLAQTNKNVREMIVALAHAELDRRSSK